jgi:outer membrane protein OmpA-like peptidoglycan-associated protein
MNNARSRFVLTWGLAVIGLVASVSAVSQVALNDTSYALFRGHVVNASTQEPVKARITFESMPYGSTIGMISGSTVEIAMDPRKDYILTVVAEGYAPYVTTVKTNNFRDVVEETIELVPFTVKSLIRLEKLIFAQGRATIAEDSYSELDNLVEMLQKNDNMTIQLEGHTDFRGNARENMKLSEKRVEAVKDYLVSKGINRNRIKTKAYGGEQPLSRENDLESRSKNRRVEVRILNE